MAQLLTQGGCGWGGFEEDLSETLTGQWDVQDEGLGKRSGQEV